MYQQGGVTTVVNNEVRAAAIGPGEHLLCAPPVLLECLTLPGKNWASVAGNGCSSVILRAEDVAGAPPDFGTQGCQSLDEHCCLDGHVQGAGNLCTLERLLRSELCSAGGQAGHLCLGQLNLQATEVSLRQVFDLVLHVKQHSKYQNNTAITVVSRS